MDRIAFSLKRRIYIYTYAIFITWVKFRFDSIKGPKRTTFWIIKNVSSGVGYFDDLWDIPHAFFSFLSVILLYSFYEIVCIANHPLRIMNAYWISMRE